MALLTTYQTPCLRNNDYAANYTPTSGTLNMRYGASSSKYDIVATINEGEIFTCMGEYNDNNGTPWLYGMYNDQYGYCHLPSLTKSSVKYVSAERSVSDINTMLKKYRNIQFAKGAKYKISTALIVHSNTIIDLNGATLRRYGADNVLESYVDPDVTTGYNGVHDVVIKNGTLEGMNSLGLRSTNLTSFMHCKNIVFENVTFLDTPGCHSCDVVGCSNVTFLNCKFLGYCTAGNDFRESIQIDYASYASLPSFPVGSKCYDMTYCKNINIIGCTFDKSDNYPSQYCAIGAHSQGNDYNYHENIVVKDCVATGNGNTNTDPSYGAFIRCMKFKNTLIEGNVIGNYARFVWITMPGRLMNPDGSGIQATDDPDKVFNVENLKVLNNKIISRGSTWQSYGMYIKDTFNKSSDILVQGLNVPSTAVYTKGCSNVTINL